MEGPLESCWKFADKQKLRTELSLLAPSLLQGLLDRTPSPRHMVF